MAMDWTLTALERDFGLPVTPAANERELIEAEDELVKELLASEDPQDFLRNWVLRNERQSTNRRCAR